MKRSFTQHLRSGLLVGLFACALRPFAQADPIPVRYPQGSIHGFLEMRGEDGHVIASGDSTQVVHGDRVTAETIFHFKDGSVDDETTVFTQHGTFRLISDHHVQKGPAFPHPSDVMINAATGMVTSHTVGRDGKDEVKTDHVNLPPDLANGLVPFAVGNMRSDSPGMTVSMVVMIPKPRVVRLVISRVGEENVSAAGAPRKAIHYEIKVELGGMIGMVAPLVGKAPPNIQIWTIGGLATTFARENGPLYPEGPMTTIQLASTVWP